MIMHLAHYLGLLHRAQNALADALREVGAAHRDEADIAHLTEQQAKLCDRRAEALRPFAERYSEDAPDEPERLHSELFRGTRSGGLGLLRDLQDLYLMAAECDICWTVVGQGAYGARDNDLLEVVHTCEGETALQLAWLRSRMKQAAPQALVVAQ
jgi:predicted RNA-binding Zn ribbon-like protein